MQKEGNILKPQKLKSLIKHDLLYGISGNKIKIIMIFAVLFFIGFISVQNYSDLLEQPGILGYHMYIFNGIPEFVISNENTKFELPIIWMLFYMMLFLWTNGYAVSDLEGFGEHVLLLAGSRKKWWISKSIWSIVVVLEYFFLSYLFILINSAIYKGKKTNFDDINDLYNWNLENKLPIKYILMIYVLPIMMCIGLILLQLLMELLISPIVAYIITCSILILSSYFKHPLAPGNYMMILRSDMVVDGGVSILNGFIFSILLIIIVFLYGLHYVKYYDVIDK